MPPSGTPAEGLKAIGGYCGMWIGGLAFSVSLILSVSWLGSQVSCSDGRTGGGGHSEDLDAEPYRGWRD